MAIAGPRLLRKRRRRARFGARLRLAGSRAPYAGIKRLRLVPRLRLRDDARSLRATAQQRCGHLSTRIPSDRRQPARSGRYRHSSELHGRRASVPNGRSAPDHCRISCHRRLHRRAQPEPQRRKVSARGCLVRHGRLCCPRNPSSFDLYDYCSCLFWRVRRYGPFRSIRIRHKRITSLHRVHISACAEREISLSCTGRTGHI